MNEEVIKMPNSIGQMDPFTEAAKAGDLGLALSILDTEIERRLSKFGTADLERKRADEGYYEAKTFRFNIAKGGETWNQCRRACGWNPDKPAEAKAAGPVVMRVEDLRLRDKIKLGATSLEFVQRDNGGYYAFLTPKGWLKQFYDYEASEFISRGVPVYRNGTLISGWPVGEHPAEAENRRLREENEALRFERDKGFDRKFQNTLAGVEARQAENERLKNELDAANSKLAAWIKAANYTPNGTPLAKPVTDPDGLTTRLKGMIEASEGLQRQLDDPELVIGRVLATAYEYVENAASTRSDTLKAFGIMSLAIKIIYNGPPRLRTYRLK